MKSLNYYVTPIGSRTIVAVYGNALLEQARAYAAKGERSVWQRMGTRQSVGEQLKRGAVLVPDEPPRERSEEEPAVQRRAP